MASTARQPDALLAWMEVLSDPTRLRLLRLLERHELGVAEVCHVLQLPQSTVSRHLKILGDQGWIRGRSKGTANLYRMSSEGGDPAARRLWALTREQTEGWATVQHDQLRLARLLAERQPSSAFFAGAACAPTSTAARSPSSRSSRSCRRTGWWRTSAAAPARPRPTSRPTCGA